MAFWFGAHPLSLVIRVVHVGAMAFMLGGGVLLLAALFKSKPAASDPQLVVLTPILRQYERYFWLAAGLIVMTGVGNLGAFGASLPGPDSTWGIKLGIKLSLVVILFLLSLPRTLLAARRPAGAALSGPARAVSMATTLLLVLILFLGVSLAHG
jgi:hypothetical protein